MGVKDLLKDSLAHMAWADAVALQVWAKSKVKEDQELRERWDHLAGVQAAFIAMLSDGDPSWDPNKALPDFEALKARSQTNHAEYAKLIKGFSDEALQVTMRIPWFPDPPCVITKAEAFQQAFMHTQHHRGQMMTRLKDQGAEAKNVDFIIWLWKGKPEPRWDWTTAGGDPSF
jgi:uncharacterized damage-inducible protein DinB